MNPADVAASEAALVKPALEALPQIQIRDQAGYDTAARYLDFAAAQYKRVEEIKRTFTGPLRDLQRAIEGHFGPPLKAYTEIQTTIKSRMLEYRRAVDAARVEQASTGAPIVAAPAESERVTVRTVRRFTIVDTDAVPRQFCSPDEAKIKAHLAAGGLEAIPGVRFFDEQVMVRTGRHG